MDIDTSYINLPLHELMHNYSISNAYNGNMVSPIQSRVYFDRLNHIQDVFGQQYQPYIITSDDVHYYNTTIPYSTVAYKKGFVNQREQNEINFLFTGNLNRRTNVGLRINYLNSIGSYNSQEAKVFQGSVFGSYSSSQYTLHAHINFNNLSNFENGGIRNITDLSGPLNSQDIPTRLSAMSGYRYINGYLNHYYSFCREVERHDKINYINDFGEKDQRDTTYYEYVPLMSIGHTFETNNSSRRYIEKSASQGFYENIYRNQKQTNDSTDVINISNTLSFTLEEAFNKVLRFGVTVFARNEFQGYLTPGYPSYTPKNEEDAPIVGPLPNGPQIMWMSDTLFTRRWLNNTYIGGSLYKRTGQWIRYDVSGDVCLVGYKMGEFNVDGRVMADFRVGKDTMYITARAHVGNETPSYYLQHYLSNHLKWENAFQKTYSFGAGGTVRYPTEWVKAQVDVDFENRLRHIYFLAADGLPYQHDGNIQIVAADARVDVTTPWVNLENRVVFQLSTSQYLPLPMLTLYHNLYYHGSWFKHAMDAQFGADVRYFTTYHSPVLNPATGQFGVQEETMIGNYPILNVYANFYVRLIHLKFFAEYTHINRLFMRDNTDCLLMPGYPMNPDVFRAGLAWHFLR